MEKASGDPAGTQASLSAPDRHSPSRCRFAPRPLQGAEAPVPEAPDFILDKKDVYTGWDIKKIENLLDARLKKGRKTAAPS